MPAAPYVFGAIRSKPSAVQVNRTSNITSNDCWHDAANVVSNWTMCAVSNLCCASGVDRLDEGANPLKCRLVFTIKHTGQESGSEYYCAKFSNSNRLCSQKL